MPNLDIHLLFDKLMFGDINNQYRFVHQILDHGVDTGIDYVKDYGVHHRKFLHDQRGINYIITNYGYEAGAIANGHIVLDKIWTHAKRKKMI
uniref:Uncharacterized protein n=1 Tax=viral metagenome TaxID=1070528 RepID=A0A6M3MEC6_9ZZZZ